MPYKVNGYKLIDIMNKRNMTVDELVKLTGVSRKTIFNYRASRHRGTTANLARIAEALDVPVEAFARKVDRDEYIE